MKMVLKNKVIYLTFFNKKKKNFLKINVLSIFILYQKYASYRNYKTHLELV